MIALLSGTTAWAGSQRVCSHQAVRATSVTMMPNNIVSDARDAATRDAAKNVWLEKNQPAWSPPEGFFSQPHRDIIVEPAHPKPAAAPEAESSIHTFSGEVMDFMHEPLSFFAVDQLVAKGSRASQGGLVDIGEPYDFTRPLVQGGKWSGASVGSWACTPGGWESPKLRPTTEVFLVLDGEGCVTDADGVAHPFGAGDVVVLPKKWHGRWDITSFIHKIWVVQDHPDIRNDDVVRAVVAPLPNFAPGDLAPVVTALHEAPAHVSHTIYDTPCTSVGFVSCGPGNFAIAPRTTAECFMVVDGTFFLTNIDGSARKCTSGDTVVLPKGWAGEWNIIEPVRKVWVEW